MSPWGRRGTTFNSIQFAFLFLLSSLSPALAVVTDSDKIRAKRSAPRPAYRAADAPSIRKLLNEHLQAGPLALPKGARKACENFTLVELSDWQRMLHEMADGEIISLLPRGDKRAPRHATVEELEKDLKQSEAMVAIAERPAVRDALRDGKCADVLMRWTHHLSQAGRDEVREWLSGGGQPEKALPLMPLKGAAEHAPALVEAGHESAAKVVEEDVTCESGHDAAGKEERGNWTGFPDWPDEVAYSAMGYGPYPFWAAGTPATGSLTEGTAITTKWSRVQNAERLDHANCALSSVGADKDGPCTDLFVDGGYAYLFAADESFCCTVSTPELKCSLTRMPRDFYNLFEYQGIVRDYVSESGFYAGPVKNYTMHLSGTAPEGFWFWYYTDLNDKPVEQGEGPCVQPRGCAVP